MTFETDYNNHIVHCIIYALCILRKCLLLFFTSTLQVTIKDLKDPKKQAKMECLFKQKHFTSLLLLLTLSDRFYVGGRLHYF